MPLLLTDEDVNRLLTLEDVFSAIEEMFRQMGRGNVSVFPRGKLHLGGGGLSILGGATHYQGMAGLKYYSKFGGVYRFYVSLLDATTAELLALLRAGRLGELRTGSATGVAAKYLARPDASTVGVLGAGAQARIQLEGVCHARPIRHARVYSPTPQKRQAYAQEMGQCLGIDVVVVEDPHDAVEGSDIVICMTTASAPVFNGDWLAPGTLVTSAGNTRWDAQEVDGTTIRRSDVVVADCLEQVRYESGELMQAVERGVLRWEQVRELAEVVAAGVPGRTSDKQIIFFKSVGFGPEDVAAAKLAYDRARERGVGEEVQF